jgi:hypothetical protein
MHSVTEHWGAVREIEGDRLLCLGEVEDASSSLYARLLVAERVSA